MASDNELDDMAVKAMAGLMGALSRWPDHRDFRRVARAAYEAARAMLAERAKDAETKREAFENFCRFHPYGCYPTARDPRPGKQDEYASSHTQIMWFAFQAGADMRTRQERRQGELDD